MYLAHWQLREAPYRNAIDPAYFFQSLTHDEALARLHFLVDGDHRGGLLLGDAGSGKSLLLEVLARQLRKIGVTVAKFSLLGLDKHELLANLAACWGLDVSPGEEAAVLWRLVLDTIAAQHIESQRNVVLLDDVDEATPEVLAQVLRLMQTDVATQPAATLILVARRARVAQLGDRLLELADLRVDLMPWNADDTQHYLEHGLARAGRLEQTFTPDAIALLAELSQGVPRNVVQLADLSLIAAAGQELSEVDAHTVHAVYHELGVVQRMAEAH
ncbi:MAG TPA: AAA family ATPase [Pirellulales bacterium]|jgi:general secretion pathway protein A